ncbi:MAG TPA: hypothetical protein ENK85_03870 [Saprospiraceae bacterium]|nr:hypothetical protein [Saprospiraceae bacterium]
MEDKNIQKELEQLAPLLKKIKEQRQQDVPDGYFQDLHQKVFSQTIENQPVQSKKRSIFVSIKIAAAILLLIGLGFLVKPYLVTVDDTNQVAQADILDYIDNNISDFSEMELGDLLQESETASSSSFSDEDILNEIDINDFSEELLEGQL